MSGCVSLFANAAACLRRALTACIVATVAACGSSDPLDRSGATTGPASDASAGPPGPAAPAAPAAPALAPPTASTLTVQGKSGALSLTWTASVDATSYVVQKSLDAGGTWTAVGAPLPVGSVTTDVKVPVAEWARASFRVQACNDAGCAASAAAAALAPMAGTRRYLKASNTGAGDQFGFGIALSADGNTLAVGAEGEDSAETGTSGTGTDDSASRSGAVYVFVRSAGAWSQRDYLKASNTGTSDWFGTTVALSADGSTLAVGAPGEASAGTGTSGTGADDSAAFSGAVYVFVRSASAWSQQAYLKASNTGLNDWFGASVALSADGNTLAVGAWGEDSAETGTSGTGADDSAADSGAVYVF